MHKIIFVEDDPEVGALIAAWLGRHALEVIVESRGDCAEARIAREQPDLLLLDIMLPGKGGMTLCRDLRASWSGPIVLHISRDSDINHILALEMGANDYILRTTPPAVLLARVLMHLRQADAGASNLKAPTSRPPQTLRFGALSIDTLNRQVVLNNAVVALSSADYDLLWTLASHAGQILHRDVLLKTLRGPSPDNEATRT